MPGYFLLSLDVEIAWGTFDQKGLIVFKKHFEDYRSNFNKLIYLVDKYKISATWAVVGHLFLDSCDGRHDNILRPKYSWFGSQDWHLMDPGTDIKKDPFWYGRDIIDKILALKVPQEIGTHTFSHVIIGDPECSEDIAYSQVKSCIDIGREEGIDICSLVFPRNKAGHLEMVRKAGICAYRGEEENWYGKTKGLNRKICHMIDQLLGITPRVYSIKSLKKVEGILNIPASQLLLSYDGFRKYIPGSARLNKALKGIAKAEHLDDAVFHLWFHPFNLGSSNKMFKVLDEIFAFVRNEEKNGRLQIATMKDIFEMVGKKE